MKTRTYPDKTIAAWIIAAAVLLILATPCMAIAVLPGGDAAGAMTLNADPSKHCASHCSKGAPIDWGCYNACHRRCTDNLGITPDQVRYCRNRGSGPVTDEICNKMKYTCGS